METVLVNFYYHLDDETEDGGHVYTLRVGEEVAEALEGDYDTVERVAGANERYATAGLAIGYLLELETGAEWMVYIDRISIIPSHREVTDETH